MWSWNPKFVSKSVLFQVDSDLQSALARLLRERTGSSWLRLPDKPRRRGECTCEPPSSHRLRLKQSHMRNVSELSRVTQIAGSFSGRFSTVSEQCNPVAGCFRRFLRSERRRSCKKLQTYNCYQTGQTHPVAAETGNLALRFCMILQGILAHSSLISRQTFVEKMIRKMTTKVFEICMSETANLALLFTTIISSISDQLFPLEAATF